MARRKSTNTPKRRQGSKPKSGRPKDTKRVKEDAPDDDTQFTERIQKILARAGLGSRRACEDMLRDRRVRVDGRVVTELGSRADPINSRISVDNKPIKRERLVYYMVNKPRGVVCTMAGDAGKRVTDIVRSDVRVFPVGRLEVDSEGLMVLTNDGSLAHQLTHPSFGVSRVYSANVDGAITEESVGKLQKGVFLAEGKTMPAEVRVTRRGPKSGTLEITIREGLNREIRRMLVAVGLKPRRIVRIRLGRLSLGDLKTGSFRVLKPGELNKMRKGLSRKQNKPPAWIKRRRTRRGLPEMNAVPSSQLKGFEAQAKRKRRILGGSGKTKKKS